MLNVIFFLLKYIFNSEVSCDNPYSKLIVYYYDNNKKKSIVWGGSAIDFYAVDYCTIFIGSEPWKL